MNVRVIEVSADRVEWLLTAILVLLLVWFLAWLVANFPKKQAAPTKSTYSGGPNRYTLG